MGIEGREWRGGWRVRRENRERQREMGAELRGGLLGREKWRGLRMDSLRGARGAVRGGG